MSIDKQAFQQLALFFDAHPDAHDQRSWGKTLPSFYQEVPGQTDPEILVTECGTSFCLAGAIAVIRGARPDINWNGNEVASIDYSYMHDPVTDRMRSTEQIARDLLFNGDPDYDWMFGANCEPRNGLTVAEAMAAIASGVAPDEVWADPENYCSCCDQPIDDCICDGDCD